MVSHRRSTFLRLALTMAMLLALGAATTVGVAWGCSFRRNGFEGCNGFPRSNWALVSSDSDFVILGHTVHAAIGYLGHHGMGVTAQKTDGRPRIIGTWVLPDHVETAGTDTFDVYPRVSTLPPSAARVRSSLESGHSVWWFACGWPWYGLTCDSDSGSSVFDPIHGALGIGDLWLPVHPIWLGFAADMVFYACAWWTLLLAPRRIRRALRQRGGLCVKCGYDLAGLAEGTACPECGQARAANGD